ncbi:MAG TPA: c-type cytochrome domain-containing protein, partial [Roseimicrobium sp.]|nr:c-type cytochrome domain-containing protein [Roseimicrobium sp.]
LHAFRCGLTIVHPIPIGIQPQGAPVDEYDGCGGSPIVNRVKTYDNTSVIQPALRRILLGLVLLGVWTFFAPSAFAASGSAQIASIAGDIFQWRPFLAPFHSVVLHFPIGFVTIAFILEFYFWLRPSEELRKAITLVMHMSWMSAVVAAAFGLMRADPEQYDVVTLDQHRWAGLSVSALTIIVTALHWAAFRKGPKTGLIWSYRFLLVGNIGLMTYAGHQGGNLTHGSNYLVKNAPDFVKYLMLEESLRDKGTPAPGTATTAGGTDKLFAEKVEPVLLEKCYSCHGPDKQKGGLRLDQREAALKGGESGDPAIKPEDPMKSNLVRLILLPKDHDDVMPPSGKSMLTSDEIVSIIHWIQTGAHYSEKDGAAAPVVSGAPASQQPAASNTPPQ